VEAQTSSSEITFDASNGILCTDFAPAKCEIELTVASGDDRMIIVALADEIAPDELHPHGVSIDINGITGAGYLVDTLVVEPDGTSQNLEMWRIMNSDIFDGVNTITVNFENSVSGHAVSVLSFSGVAQQPEEAKASNSVLDIIEISTEITTLTDGALIVSLVGSGSPGEYTSHGIGQIEQIDIIEYSGEQAVTTEIAATFGPNTQSHIFSVDTFRQGQIVASFAPASESSLDTQKPVITTYGTSKSIQIGSTYTELGATVTDNDPAYSGKVTIGGDVVNTSVAGSYVILYTAPADAAGNTPDTKSITNYSRRKDCTGILKNP